MPSTDAPFMIAVTGGSGSGKSTLASALSARIGAEHVLNFSEDNYYRPREHYHVDAPTWSAEEMEKRVDFDDPQSKSMDMLESHLDALKRGESIRQPVYDFARHDRRMGQETTLDPKPIIIAEGVHVLCEPRYFDLFDLTVFVDTPADLRLARRIQRGTKERGRDLDRILAQYLNFVRPAHARYTEPAKIQCDLIIQDEGPLASTLNKPDKKAEDRLVAPVWTFLTDNHILDGL